MKKFLISILFIVFLAKLSGQSHGITYQAVIIDINAQEIPGADITGNYMPDQPLTVRFTILDESVGIDYQEEHVTRTDEFGIINLTIGRGTMTTSAPHQFTEIDWNGRPKDLKVDISLGESASTFTELSLQELLFVPYAYHRNITATGTLIVDGAALLKNTLTVDGSSTLNSSLTVNAASGLNGQVTINADVNGGDDQYGSYPLRIEGSNQGIGIRIDGSRNADNNFITFWDQNGIQGRVEGQTDIDLLLDPQYIFDQALYATQAIVQGINLATAVAASIIDPGNAVIEAANSVALVAEIAAYNVFAFTNLGVTYESGAGDYAEWLPRLHPEEEIRFGQVVGLYGGMVSKSTDGADMIMVVSNAPIILGNMPSDSLSEELCEKVGFIGQVPVWVIGKVNKGDFIISYKSNSGLGEAISTEKLTVDMMSKIVGRAWTSSDNEGVKLINTGIGIKTNEWIKFIRSNKNEIDSLREELSFLKEEIASRDEVLTKLLPGYTEALKEESKSREATVNGINSAAINPNIQKITKSAVKPVLVYTRESVKEIFTQAAAALEAQGYDVKNDPFYSKLNSDPEYREKVIDQILKSQKK
jgi:hypothetical protein